MSGTEGLSAKIGVTDPTIIVHRQDQAAYNAADIVFNTGPTTQDDLVFVWGGGLLGGGPTWSTRALVQRRTKSGGVWSAPETILSVGRGGGSAKSPFSFNDTFAGVFEDVEYSIVAQIAGGSSIPTSNGTVASDFYIRSQTA